MPDAIASIQRFRIAGVKPIWLSGISEKRQDIVATEFIQRTDEQAFPLRWHAGQSGQAASPKNPQENGFRLIIGGVAEGDTIGAEFPRQIRHRPIPQRPRVRLKRSPFRSAPDFQTETAKGNRQHPAKADHERLIILGLRPAQSIIEVDRRQRQSPLRRQTVKQPKQRDRVGPPGYREQKMMARIEEGS
jgi:hypothetical protein